MRTLTSEGPRFDGTPSLGTYHEIIEIVSADEWVFRSELKLDDCARKESVSGSRKRVGYSTSRRSGARDSADRALAARHAGARTFLNRWPACADITRMGL